MTQAARVSLDPRVRLDVIVLDGIAVGDGCWEWQRSMNSYGYGRIRLWSVAEQRSPTRSAHRAVYEMLRGPVPAGLELDHLCRNRACVRPSHLEPVTRRENLMRSAGLPAQNAGKTHCKRGHEFAGGNLRVARDGSRHCRTCRRERDSSPVDAELRTLAGSLDGAQP